jgi:hypothetical protein
MKKITKFFIYLTVIILSVAFIHYGHAYVSENSHSGIIYDKETELDAMVFATITSIDNIVEDNTDSASREITFTGKTFGNGKSETVHGRQILNDSTKNISPVSAGDKVALLSFGDNLLFQYHYRLIKLLFWALFSPVWSF